MSTVRQLTGEPSEALTALGVQLSDVLSADRLLLVEGRSDREILTVWFPELLSDPRVEVAIGHGGDYARFAGRIEEWLQAIDRQHHRRVLYLRDRDELSTEALNQLEAASVVDVLRRRELENYLLEADGVTLERFRTAVAERLPSEQLIDEITKRWLAAEKELEAAWEEHWGELAPGSDVLAYLWGAHGRSYDKLHDGVSPSPEA